MEKCLHGMDRRYCALCNGVVRAVPQATYPTPKQVAPAGLYNPHKHEERAQVPIAQELSDVIFGTALDNQDPNKIYCSFCGSEVEQVEVLVERTKPRIRYTTDVYRDPDTQEISEHRRIQVRTEELKACKKCCLQIRKPIVVTRI